MQSYPGKGYGKLMLQFAINEAINRGINNIQLRAIQWNKRALNLYRNLGFDIVQTNYYYRLFIL